MPISRAFWMSWLRCWSIASLGEKFQLVTRLTENPIRRSVEHD